MPYVRVAVSKITRRPIPDMRPFLAEIMERVEQKSEPIPVTGCWIWTGWCNQFGYPDTTWKSRSWAAHRLVYAAHHGPFDPKLDICHSCDVPACVNPAHLRADTHRNNIKEASEKGRLRWQDRTHCKRGHPLSGENLTLDRDGWKGCRTCELGKCRRKAGWPEHLWYSPIRVPFGYRLDFDTMEFVTTRRRRAA